MTEPKTTNCPACDGLVSLAAPACPHCGHPMDRPASHGGAPPRAAAVAEGTEHIWRMSHIYFVWRYILAAVLPLLPLIWNLLLGGGGAPGAEGTEGAAPAEGAVAAQTAGSGLQIHSPWVWYVCLGLLAISLFLLGGALIRRLGTRYALTHDGYVREQHGLLTRMTAELHVSDIRLVNLHQNVWQRIFGIGSIDISSAGNAGIEVRFVGVPDAEQIKERILDRAESSDD
ncbi:PH domain-containing protein [Engelhardtia mirabilis]|uniref:Bacterial membrane flanked domain protein n=1 Tax=Engelhardtia mirabilis TaxID=2528011 RepID=A0A518BHZ6_9BACT|nr:Bacterial membrane flanked domain protein [Planctomycetes bacterium Pla133]QDV00911.1 Bacterial membrane flanked domain protein [Planctomycetes bacterium Pla86]